MLNSLRHLAKFAYALGVLAREGVLAETETDPFPPALAVMVRTLRLIERRGAAGRADRLSAALTRLGPSYVKLGQFLATRPDVVGTKLAADLEQLQDGLAPFGTAAAGEIIQRSLGRPVGALFTSFADPVAAASIAQVHEARVRDERGIERRVAVKVLRPGVARRFRRDVQTFYRVAEWLEWLHPPLRRLRPVAVVDTLARSVAIEMDLRLEAAALSEMGENTAGDAGFRVPAVDWARTAKDVLTMEWVEGVPFSDTAALAAAGHDLPALGRLLIQSFLRHAMRDGFFHADMHPGNLFVDAAGRLVAVDLGITGRLAPPERRFLAEILYGFIRRDYARVAEVHFAAGYVPPDESVAEFARALRSIGEPIHDRPAEEISMARLLTQLFEVTELFRMRTRPELIMLQKTMVVVEGVARRLDPRLDMWTAAEPVVREWIERNLGPLGHLEDAVAGGRMLRRAAEKLPALLLRAERAAADIDDALGHGVRIAPESLERLAAMRRSRSRGVLAALWTGAIALAVIAWHLARS